MLITIALGPKWHHQIAYFVQSTAKTIIYIHIWPQKTAQNSSLKSWTNECLTFLLEKLLKWSLEIKAVVANLYLPFYSLAVSPSVGLKLITIWRMIVNVWVSSLWVVTTTTTTTKQPCVLTWLCELSPLQVCQKRQFLTSCCGISLLANSATVNYKMTDILGCSLLAKHMICITVCTAASKPTLPFMAVCWEISVAVPVGDLFRNDVFLDSLSATVKKTNGQL